MLTTIFGDITHMLTTIKGDITQYTNDYQRGYNTIC